MEDGAKRRLPPWMSRVAATANRVSQSEEEDRPLVHNNVQEATALRSLQPKSKPKAKRIKKDALPANGSSEVNTCVLAEYESKQKRRKKLKFNHGPEGASSVIEVHETNVEKKKSNGGGRKLKKQIKKKSLRYESSEEIKTPYTGEDDGDLTMEDLMTIAQEYVRADEHMEKQKLSLNKHYMEPSPTFTLLGQESGVLPDAPLNNRRQPLDKEILSACNSSDGLPGEATIVNPNRTGDPAQDMLDLFLGPLLRKPTAEGKTLKMIEDDMIFVREAKQQNKLTSEELVPLTKKKSSLKDKVAMFFGQEDVKNLLK